jgi:hypothetical protein
MLERDALISFLRGDLRFAQLAARLRLKAVFRFRDDVREVQLRRDLGIRIRVGPADLRPVLLKYVIGTVPADVISVWAAVIVLLPAFERPGDSNPAVEMWELLRELSLPPAATNVTARRVARLLAKLPSVEQELARQA